MSNEKSWRQVAADWRAAFQPGATIAYKSSAGVRYQRVSAKLCPRHPAPPVNFRERARKWLRKPYRSTSGSRCDCPSVEINVPATDFTPTGVFYSSDEFVGGEYMGGAILAIGRDGSEFISPEEYKRRTGEEWD